MASKTHVDGNKVTIDDSLYHVTAAGGQYAVTDEFGLRTGYFSVRGRVVTPEDYGVEGAHPVLQIGKLWAAANLWKANEKSASSVPTKGFCRVVTHEKASEADLEKARAYRAWMRKQPGCKASYFVTDPATGKGMTISIWETRDQMNAAKEARPPEGATQLKSLGVEVFPMVEEP
ncbi:hypothetical protein [Polyangium sp. y55x31]|uniref:hypothetical protein n=1 Tax=Polyangium sp. y55x31 TaxID=3042688 RepID=UPI0024822885|nr:hypothetical protein [Polyangium sp. y55x31]MDI1481826.1 hypothetical protein [Polyangium sp. y55x31]